MSKRQFDLAMTRACVFQSVWRRIFLVFLDFMCFLDSLLADFLIFYLFNYGEDWMWTGGCCVLSRHLDSLFNSFFHVYIWRFDWVGLFLLFVMTMTMSSVLVLHLRLDLTWI